MSKMIQPIPLDPEALGFLATFVICTLWAVYLNQKIRKHNKQKKGAQK